MLTALSTPLTPVARVFFAHHDPGGTFRPADQFGWVFAAFCVRTVMEMLFNGD
jgi:hypothetical protein